MLDSEFFWIACILLTCVHLCDCVSFKIQLTSWAHTHLPWRQWGKRHFKKPLMLCLCKLTCSSCLLFSRKIIKFVLTLQKLFYTVWPIAGGDPPLTQELHILEYTSFLYFYRYYFCWKSWCRRLYVFWIWIHKLLHRIGTLISF